MKQPENIIIYGAEDSAVIRRIISGGKGDYNVVAFLDDDIKLKGSNLQGLPIVGDRTSARETMKLYDSNTIVVALVGKSPKELKELYSYLLDLKANVKVLKTDDNSQTPISFEKLNIVHLLGRDEHKMNRKLLRDLIVGKTVMVTGGAGSIGSEICRQVLALGCKKLLVFDWYENGLFELNEELKGEYLGRYKTIIGSVQNAQKLEAVFSANRPEIVFHAAAYKHVPMMEINADEAVENNIFGTKNLIEIAEKYGAERFTLISTDKAVNPSSVMGATKRVAEMLLQSHASYEKAGTIFSAVRFGNVLGSSGSVIPTFIKQIAAGGPVTVTHRKMKRYFMSIPEAVMLVMEASSLAKGGEVFVLDMGEPVYIYDLAKDLIRLAGRSPEEIPIKITGLRPGEKLFEELRFGDEEASKTTLDGIFINKLQPTDREKLESALSELEKAAEKADAEKAEKTLFSLIETKYRKS